MRVITDPGLNVKMPFIDSVIYIDKRILNVESQAQEVNVQSQDNVERRAKSASVLVVDAFARYRITDALKFYQSGRSEAPASQLRILLNSALRQVLGAATLPDVVRNKREELMGADRAISSINRMPQADSASKSLTCASAAPTCRRRTARPSMPACRPSGSAKRPSSAPKAVRRAQEIKAKADRDVTVIIAEANQQSEQIRGEGDGERNSIFAGAYGQDPGFFTFYRSMQAYERSFQKGDTNLVLRPDSDFFRYFGDPKGGAGAGGRGAGIVRPSGRHAAAPAPGRTDARAAATAPAR